MPRVKKPKRRKVPGSKRSVQTRSHTRDARGPKPGPRVRVRSYRRRPPRS